MTGILPACCPCGEDGAMHRPLSFFEGRPIRFQTRHANKHYSLNNRPELMLIPRLVKG